MRLPYEVRSFLFSQAPAEKFHRKIIRSFQELIFSTDFTGGRLLLSSYFQFHDPTYNIEKHVSRCML